MYICVCVCVVLCVSQLLNVTFYVTFYCYTIHDGWLLTSYILRINLKMNGAINLRVLLHILHPIFICLWVRPHTIYGETVPIALLG